MNPIASTGRRELAVLFGLSLLFLLATAEVGCTAPAGSVAGTVSANATAAPRTELSKYFGH
ncbi:MAG TPA: hypothetical protein VM536_07500 [Chloroflexia bacterium]|nr:hypothetical protein [Chloroflexia bacterium]